MAVCQNLVPLVNIKIAGKWMFIPLKMVLIGIDPYPYTRHSSCLTHRSTAMSKTRVYPVRPTICDEGSIHPHWWIGMIICLTMMAINWRHRQIHHFGTSSQSYYCDRWWHIQFSSTVYNITNLSFLFHGGGRIWLRPTFPLQSLQYTFLLITNSRYIFNYAFLFLLQIQILSRSSKFRCVSSLNFP